MSFQVSVPISAGEMVGVALFHKLEPPAPRARRHRSLGLAVRLPHLRIGPCGRRRIGTAHPIRDQWVAMTAEIDGEEGGGTEPPSCIGSLCSTPTIPSLTIPSLTLQSPQPALRPKKCKKGKKRKHGECVKKHKKKPKR